MRTSHLVGLLHWVVLMNIHFSLSHPTWAPPPSPNKLKVLGTPSRGFSDPLSVGDVFSSSIYTQFVRWKCTVYFGLELFSVLPWKKYYKIKILTCLFVLQLLNLRFCFCCCDTVCVRVVVWNTFLMVDERYLI
jgi:hypothetical protein